VKVSKKIKEEGKRGPSLITPFRDRYMVKDSSETFSMREERGKRRSRRRPLRQLGEGIVRRKPGQQEEGVLRRLHRSPWENLNKTGEKSKQTQVKEIGREERKWWCVGEGVPGRIKQTPTRNCSGKGSSRKKYERISLRVGQVDSAFCGKRFKEREKRKKKVASLAGECVREKTNPAYGRDD